MKGKLTMKESETIKKNEIENMSQILDRGIEDMEAGRELSLDDAFDLIAELVEKRKIARA